MQNAPKNMGILLGEIKWGWRGPVGGTCSLNRGKRGSVCRDLGRARLIYWGFRRTTMKDKEKKQAAAKGCELKESVRQILRHPLCLLLVCAQFLFCLLCVYVSGVPVSAGSEKKTAILVRKTQIAKFPFARADKWHYIALDIADNIVTGKTRILYSESNIEELRGRVKFIKLPISLPAYPLAAAFFGVFALGLGRILEFF